MLGNMGGFFAKGVEGHVMNGVPWPMQNGLFCATFYHFFVHDTNGIIGRYLRAVIPYRFGLKDRVFAMVVVSFFMQVMGILQIPRFLGPSFTPFGTRILNPFMDSTTWTVGRTDNAYQQQQSQEKTENDKKKD